jgi:putative ABC transport system permease protein
MIKKKENPPRLARWILSLQDHYEKNYSITGDCSEEYKQIAQQRGKPSALFWIWGQVLSVMVLSLKRSLFFGETMFINYLKITLRNIKRHKAFSFINIAGLGIGLAISLFILLWVQDELSYDRFHKNLKNIYRIVEQWEISAGSVNPGATTPYPLGPALRDNYQEVEESLHFLIEDGILVRYKDKRFYENKFAFADANFFSMFSFPLLEGSAETAIKDLNSLVISQSMAKKYFGDEDPMGRILTTNARHDFIVSGIMLDMPHNSHIQADFICNFEFLIANQWSKRWVDHMYYTYVRLRPDTDLETLGAKIETFINDNQHDPTTIHIALQPLKDIHLRSNFNYDMGGTSQGKALYVYIFSIVAVLVLLIACINFMNLATAKSATRAKEIGIRKVSGASKSNLIKQFMGESFFMSLLAFLFALICVAVLLQEFNSLTGKNLNGMSIINGSMFFYALVLAVITGLLAGVYPAIYLSSFSPSSVLKGKLRSGTKSRHFRGVLVVFQFSLSTILLVGTFVIRDQLAYMQDKNLGINKENIIYMEMRGKLKNNHDAFRTELTQHPEIKSVTTSSELPTNIRWATTGVDWEGKTPGYRIHWSVMSVDFDYIYTFGLEIVEGRNFSKEMSTDTEAAYIINETGAAVLGYERAIGKKFSLWDTEGTIIGVARDFHIDSLHEQIEPLIIKVNPRWNSFVFVKISSNNIRGVIAKIEEIHQRLNPEYPFQFHFLNAEYENIYLSEKRTGRLFRYFSFLAIFISCLGLFGLSSFMAEQRTKEIGIKRVLGAKVSVILLQLLRDFTKWVLIANVIAWPIGYYAMKQWLKNFAYQTEFDWSIFLFSGVITLLIAVTTVGFKSLRAATANPVDSLRYE